MLEDFPLNVNPISGELFFDWAMRGTDTVLWKGTGMSGAERGLGIQILEREITGLTSVGEARRRRRKTGSLEGSKGISTLSADADFDSSALRVFGSSSFGM
jgi:hypothetical protein